MDDDLLPRLISGRLAASARGVSPAVRPHLSDAATSTSVATSAQGGHYLNMVGGSFRNELIARSAGAVAGAATMSVLDGTSFGDNLMQTLPQAIGQTIGNATAGYLETQWEERGWGKTPLGQLGSELASFGRAIDGTAASAGAWAGQNVLAPVARPFVDGAIELGRDVAYVARAGARELREFAGHVADGVGNLFGFREAPVTAIAAPAGNWGGNNSLILDPNFQRTQSVYGDVFLRQQDLRQLNRPPALTDLHQEIIAMAEKYGAHANVHQWTNGDALAYAPERLFGLDTDFDIFDFKDQWVSGYSDVIIAAAAAEDLPAELLAGVAYNEVGGDRSIFDSGGYYGRSHLPLGKDPLRTSFGPMSIQVIVAGRTLGYEGPLTTSQAAAIISSLEDPVQSIFISAKHISDLRDVDFSGVHADDLTRSQIQVIAARYNRGAGLPLASIKGDVSYGLAITKRWDHLAELLYGK